VIVGETMVKTTESSIGNQFLNSILRSQQPNRQLQQ